ncbi:DUF599 domain-containing protein [Aestuariibius sp. HNIBRBA575]|uniref:DUF599 domain-containing protein n=1 Tax=Aestuariibius sp. HNIBRBA575 TaxID=3233343 RepID=UPI0034A0E99D
MPNSLLDIIQTVSWIDWGALGYLLIGAVLIGLLIENPPKSRPSVSMIMAEYRRDWMRTFATREVRIFDSQILGNLRQGTSFFASTSLLALGAVLALIGNTEPLSGLALELAQEEAPALVWQVKLLVVAYFLISAFLRFVWSHRVFGYCSVLMAATPEQSDDPNVDVMAQQAAELNIRAAVNFNRGLRGIYFALGALAWLLGPAALIIATTVTLWVLWSREFNSIPRQIILR